MFGVHSQSALKNSAFHPAKTAAHGIFQIFIHIRSSWCANHLAEGPISRRIKFIGYSAELELI
jgi:hypothetical protein